MDKHSAGRRAFASACHLLRSVCFDLGCSSEISGAQRLKFVTLGWLLGGTVGLGTVAAVVLVGPMAQFWLPRTEAITRKLIGE